jgi:hypothetical protein
VNDSGAAQDVYDISPIAFHEAIEQAKSMAVGGREQMTSGRDGPRDTFDGGVYHNRITAPGDGGAGTVCAPCRDQIDAD